MGRAVKQALIAAVLSGALAALTGCMSVAPKAEPTVTTTKHRPKLVRTTSTPKIGQQKKVTAKKVIKPVEETAPVVVPPLGGGSNGGGGGGWG
ncbi:hypothetical protein EB815_30315 [Mesorhizobium loti]|uniref:Uncharacterized protein n=1 Tax=Rhizobium loti TaxID=381 RepID=A0A6M7U6I3_RHILI|nr:hypothetical protein ASE05_05915 [Mesorhizobium sp. Root172]OBQ72978.1 hypothetical protein A8145_00730 [Mesorhizobium loti]QKC72981.1 hypothetical protein EB815_30315 [Mesorhizobium loti]